MTITATIAKLEARDEVDQDAKYVQLVVSVANQRIDDPAEIHATLKALGRDSSHLDRDLDHYARVREDFDQFAQLREAEVKQRDAEDQATDARERISRLRDEIANLQAQLALATEAADRYEGECRQTHSAVLDARQAAGRLIDEPSRLRFLPASFGDKMQAVAQLRGEVAALEKECAEIHGQINRRYAESQTLTQQITYARKQLAMDHLAGFANPDARLRKSMQKNADAQRNFATAQAVQTEIQNGRSRIDENTLANAEASQRHDVLAEQLKQARDTDKVRDVRRGNPSLAEGPAFLFGGMFRRVAQDAWQLRVVRAGAAGCWSAPLQHGVPQGIDASQ